MLKNCPFCGFSDFNETDSDIIYPSGSFWREEDGIRSYYSNKTRKETDNACWNIVCNGCGVVMYGDSKEEVIEKWERRI